MAYEFKFPDVGEGITEGELLTWKVQQGDAVSEGQTLAEVETDKAVVELPSPRTGKVVKLHAEEGDVINVGDVVVSFAEEGEAVEETPQPSPAGRADKTAPAEKAASGEQAPEQTAEAAEKGDEEDSAEPYTGSVVGVLEEAPDEEPEPAARAAVYGAKDVSGGPAAEAGGTEREPAEPGPDVLALPSVRALAKELGVDLNAVRGTGAGGRILKQDVQDVAQWGAYGGPMAASGGGAKAEGSAQEGRGTSRAAAESKAVFGGTMEDSELGPVERVAFRGVRRTMAKRMAESSTKQAQVTVMDEADVTILRRIRNKERDVAKERGVRLTYLAFVIKACTAALRRFPRLNASLLEDQEEFVVKHYYNIGIAVDTPNGLMVPNIKAADGKSIFSIAEEVIDLVERAEERTLEVAELHGGSFTITNFGAIGSTFATPIVNYPEVAILGMGRVRELPVVREDKVVTRLMMPLSLTFDHQLIDGAEATRFLNTVIGYLEDPDLLLLEGA